jgi:hypothetical protein
MDRKAKTHSEARRLPHPGRQLRDEDGGNREAKKPNRYRLPVMQRRWAWTARMMAQVGGEGEAVEFARSQWPNGIEENVIVT